MISVASKIISTFSIGKYFFLFISAFKSKSFVPNSNSRIFRLISWISFLFDDAYIPYILFNFSFQIEHLLILLIIFLSIFFTSELAKNVSSVSAEEKLFFLFTKEVYFLFFLLIKLFFKWDVYFAYEDKGIF